MKIGISTSVVQRGKTGIAQYLFALLRAFDRDATEHRFCLFVLEEDRPLFRDLNGKFEIIPVAERFRPAVKNILWHQTVLPKLGAQLELDVVHVPSYRRLLWSAPCPRVATIHDLAPFRVSKKYDFARMFYGRVVVKQLARRQDEIIAVSQNTARDIEEFFGIPQNRIRVVHNGLEHDRFHPRNREAARQHLSKKFPLEKPFLLYVARLEHPGKNHVRLIEAFEKFKAETNSEQILAFGGSDWHGAEVIHERIRNSPQRDSIRSLGFISNEDLPFLYSAAEAFVYPSLYEGFGLPPLEAMACGCPVICSARGSLGEVAQDAALIIKPEDVPGLAGALRNVTLDSALRARLIEKGLKRAADFSWERTARGTLAAYESADRKHDKYGKGGCIREQTLGSTRASMAGSRD